MFYVSAKEYLHVKQKNTGIIGVYVTNGATLGGYTGCQNTKTHD